MIDSSKRRVIAPALPETERVIAQTPQQATHAEVPTGPWTVEARDADEFWFGRGYYAITDGKTNIAVASVGDSSTPAKMRLIAAAPDLLEALLDMVTQAEGASGLTRSDEEAIERARAAIDKATTA